MITIDKSYNGKKILAQKGDIIELQLDENPTTGYIWKINSFDNKHLNYLENKYQKSIEAIGAGGIRTFSFEAIDKGSGELHVSLGNPWEQDAEDSLYVTINVT